MTSQRGFTLLELMVVVIIIGTIMAMISLRLGNQRGDDELMKQAERLEALMILASEEAQLQGRDVGIQFRRDGYQFFLYDGLRRVWLEWQNDPLFRARTFRDEFELELLMDDQAAALPVNEEEDDVDLPTPQIMILSSGEMTPFEIIIASENADFDVALRANPLGTLETEKLTDGFR